ncbi:MAG: bifunctional nuclease family protein [Bacteroidales bacterium]|nr:bifunctional nuclease family protein [Bacteroidales bacterium]
MNKVRLEIIGMSYSESSTGAYVLVLGDKNSQRRLPIVIGNAEAQAIAVGIERQPNSRPLTHDLLLKINNTFSISILEVVINRFRDGVFYAMLVCRQGNDIVTIDARPSDAIALAVRIGCEIYAYESVMQEAGIIMDDMEEDESERGDNFINEVQDEPDIELLTLHELEDLLQMAIDEEDYEKAARIRDEINSRK